MLDEDRPDPGRDGAELTLRQRAEAELLRGESSADDPEALAPDAMRSLLHELHVHQIELEMQNDELRQTQEKLAFSRTRYFELYDLAPVGYCTLSASGLIRNANLTLCRLLRVPRSSLVQQPLSAFVFAQDQDDYYLQRKRLLESRQPTAWELRLHKPDGTHFWAHAAANVVTGEQEATELRVVLTDITERKQAEALLVSSQADLRRLLAARDAVQEEERKRIARELHDDLQQTLAAIRIDIQVILDRLPANPAAAMPLVSEVDRLAQAAVASTRRIVNDLRPQLIDEMGLVLALKELTTQFARLTGIVCRLDAADDIEDALCDRPAVASSLYRITQEALNNVAKHAKASRVEVGLSRTSDGMIRLRISDNGVGLREQGVHNSHSFGLLGMAERVREMGGQWHIEAPAGVGTTIEVLVPAISSGTASEPPRAGS